eukprot:m.40394 g.40394  ORF g.40394 m.40394 type:complete len:205 (+) comp10435_c0_seq2:423-1037(+)
MAKTYDMLAKILLLGKQGAGKTAMLLRYSEDLFPTSYISTIGIDFKIRRVEQNGVKIKLQIWDTAGQERFKTITASFLRGVMGVILVYSICDREKFQNVRSWLKTATDNATEDLSLVLVGNKADLQAERQVTAEEGQQLADEFQCPFFETSAKQNVNVSEAFTALTAQVMEKHGGKQRSAISSSDDIVDPRTTPPAKLEKNGCC